VLPELNKPKYSRDLGNEILLLIDSIELKLMKKNMEVANGKEKRPTSSPN